MYFWGKFIFNFSISSKFFILYCPFPSYPSVHVFKIPGIKFEFLLISSRFSINLYSVVFMPKLFIKSFSVMRFWIILFISGFGITFFKSLSFFKVS